MRSVDGTAIRSPLIRVGIPGGEVGPSHDPMHVHRQRVGVDDRAVTSCKVGEQSIGAKVAEKEKARRTPYGRS